MDCLNETFTVSGLLPDPLPHALSEAAAVTTARATMLTAVGRTGTTSSAATALWPGGSSVCPVKVSGVV
jgi:hypothetical protein